MVVSWRVSALVLLGAIPLIAAPSIGFVWCWAGGCLALSALDALTAVSPRELRVRREVDGPIRADETSTSVLTITNPTRRRLRLVVRDGWPPSLRPAPAHHTVRVEAGSSVVLRTRLAPTRRGTREADYATLRVWGALGLGGRQISIDAPLALSVLPAFRARVLLPSRLARLHELEGTTPTTLRGAGTEFDSLREYVRGDDPRDIDWRASARSKELMVRTWRPERDRHVVVVVDCGRASAALLGAPDDAADAIEIGVAPRLDSGIETALLLGALATRAGDQVHLLALDQRVRARVSGVRGGAFLGAAATAFQEVVPSLDVTDWQLAVSQVRATVHHPALVVLVTRVPPAGMDVDFLEAVRALADRHTVLVASATDPDQDRARADDGDVLMSAAAALEERTDQAGVADARSAGAVVVSAP
ncbi:PF01882 family protein, partial [Schaalia georgiae F0490]